MTKIEFSSQNQQIENEQRQRQLQTIQSEFDQQIEVLKTSSSDEYARIYNEIRVSRVNNKNETLKNNLFFFLLLNRLTKRKTRRFYRRFSIVFFFSSGNNEKKC